MLPPVTCSWCGDLSLWIGNTADYFLLGSQICTNKSTTCREHFQLKLKCHWTFTVNMSLTVKRLLKTWQSLISWKKVVPLSKDGETVLFRPLSAAHPNMDNNLKRGQCQERLCNSSIFFSYKIKNFRVFCPSLNHFTLYFQPFFLLFTVDNIWKTLPKYFSSYKLIKANISE